METPWKKLSMNRRTSENFSWVHLPKNNNIYR